MLSSEYREYKRELIASYKAQLIVVFTQGLCILTSFEILIRNLLFFLKYSQLIVVFPRDYVNKFKHTDATFEILIRNESFFREKFTQFLFSPKGASYQVPLGCNL